LLGPAVARLDLWRTAPGVFALVLLVVKNLCKMTIDMAEYLKRALRKPQQSFFLLGPRGTGKTTWVRHEFPEAHVISLLDEALYQSYLADIGRFAAELRALPEGAWVFVDEIQRLPNLLNEVHRFIEERGLRFILTGSSARKLKRAEVNLLAGRALLHRMHPFLPSELGVAFDLERVLRWGSIPLIWESPDRDQSLKAYVQLYLKEEIKAEALVRSLPGFARFLPVAAAMHGQQVSVSSAARDAEVGRTTLAGYLEILEDTLLAFRLPAFEARLRVRERRHPKLYWFDPGVVRAVEGRTGELHPQERGTLFEGWVAALLRASRDYFEAFEEFFYWAPAANGNVEVDFLLTRGGQYLALEAKSAPKVQDAHLKGLRAVASLKGLQRRTVVYTGDRVQRTPDGIDLWPVPKFLKHLDDGTLWG
jgi:predicted AAA+ superfamily ATPase